MARFMGDVNANERTINYYLRQNFTMPDGGKITRESAAALMEKHPAEVESAIKLSSFAYYPGDKIADAEGLLFIDLPEEEDSEYA